MRLTRVIAITKKNLRSLKNDRRTVGFIVLMPLLMITIFGYTFGGEVENVRVYVVNLDQTPPDQSIAEGIISNLRTRDTLRIMSVYTNPTEVAVAIQKVRDADAWAAIVFNESFTRDVAASSGGNASAVIRLIVDSTNPNIVQAISSDILAATRAVLGLRAFVAPITISTEAVYGKDARFIDFFAPGVMGLAAMMVTFMLSIISFVHERGASTLDRLLSTPATEGDIVAGYALAFGLVGLAQSVVIMTAAILLFDVMIVGNVLLALLVVFLLGVGNQGLGFMLSAFAKNEFQAIQFLPLILFPSLLLSGVFWPLEAIPPVLRPVSSFVPLTYAVEGLRCVMIRGWSIDGILLELVVLIAFAAAMLMLSTYGLKRRR
ncbi:MAG: ABC transporter permease [Thermoplasmata archaeon]